MEGWKDGRMEGWKDGRMEGWKDGRMEGWKDGRMEGWPEITEGNGFTTEAQRGVAATKFYVLRKNGLAVPPKKRARNSRFLWCVIEGIR